MNKLDDKVIIDREVAKRCHELLQQKALQWYASYSHTAGLADDIIASYERDMTAIWHALATDLTGWVAVKENIIASQRMGGCRYPISQRRWQAILEASPPLPGGGE